MRKKEIKTFWQKGKKGKTIIEYRKHQIANNKGTRPDTRLPKSRAGGQGPYLRSLDHLGRSSEVKEIKS